jgi:LPS-assembly protein
VNIQFIKRPRSFFTLVAYLRAKYLWLLGALAVVLSLLMVIYNTRAFSAAVITEPVQACVVARDIDLTDALRERFAQCLGWQSDNNSPVCLGKYSPLTVIPLSNNEEVHILADKGSFYQNKPSTLRGHIEIQQGQRIVNAQTATVYRDATSHQINEIVFLGNVRYLEPNTLMIAKKAIVHPKDHSGQTEDVLYRFSTDKSNGILPAWGRAALIKRFANKDYLLRKATYTTCAPKDKAWDLQADSIIIDNAHATGIARNAQFRIRQWPILYFPYLRFPTNKERKSGFLLPIAGYSDTGGFDFGLPYYWNIAPNYDLTIVPHAYSKRGVMLGGEFRYLTSNSTGAVTGDFLPHDTAYSNFLYNNEALFPRLRNNSTNRWSVGVLETSALTPDINFNLNVAQVSDDYYLQDFSTNLALLTQRQLLRQADVTYTSDHWLVRAMGQSYQTLHPVNEIPVSSVYERLPELMGRGFYYDLPFNANVTLLGQYDQFHWPSDYWSRRELLMPQGPRLHFNPIISAPQIKPWGYVTPSIQFVNTYYEVQNNRGFRDANYNRGIPRYSLDSGLYFERDTHLFGNQYIQTLEPRLFYLRVPYQNQTAIPVYDSGYTIFNMDQLFRTNRFSGFDRIGDAHQLSYALTSRWMSEQTGAERLLLSMGQIKYFTERQVQLCQSITGYCTQDPNAFGYLSADSGASPIASRAVYQVNSLVGITGDYMWDPATRATNNADLIVHYQPDINKIVNVGYSYLVNGDVTQVRRTGHVDNALHQAILAVAWPLSDRWSTLGAYSHNISKNYSMMSLFGVQYDSCCWAMRILGGRTFKNLNQVFEPQYNDSVYIQFLFKGLGAVATSDPYSILNTYIPGYDDPFHRNYSP